MANAQSLHLPSDHQQISFHFWKCQLTEASPKYSWDPENWANAAKTTGDKGERSHLRRHGDGENTDKKESNGAANGDSNGHSNGDSNGHSNGKQTVDTNGNGARAATPDGDENGEEAAIDADYMQHVLKVNACILGARATGVHLISVRTKCYQSEQPDTCPIVCIDPASQRTLTLGYEFVLDSQNEVTFELTEGTGPVWLTGLHQVRMHDRNEDCCGELDDGDEEADGSSIGSEEDKECHIDATSRFRLANGKGNGVEQDEVEGEEVEEEELMEEGDSESEDDSDSEEDTEKKSKRPTLGKRSPITTAQLRNRKRQRLGPGDVDE